MTSSRVARASLWAMAGGTSQHLITLGLLIYLARTLNPRDFGLMATITVGLELGVQLVRWGQVELLQQSRYQNDEARNQTVRVSLAIATILAVAFVIVAQPVARAFQAPELAAMFYLCAPVFLFSALHATADGILRSQFQFRKLAYRGSIASVLGGVVAIGLASTGFGAIALATQRLVQAGISAIWVWSAVNWRPKMQVNVPFSWAMVREGGHTMVGSILPTLVPRSIDLMIGVVLGPALLGLYKIAFRIFELAAQVTIMPLASVATAQLARFSSDMAGLRGSYLRFTQVSASLLCPLMIGFAILSPDVVPILFGPKWTSAIPLVQMVSILALTSPPNYFFPAAMIAIGQSRLVIRQGVFQIIVGLGLAAVAVQYSLTAVLLTQIVRGMLLTAYNFADLRLLTGLRLRAVARHMAPPYMASGIMAAIMIGLRFVLADQYPPPVVIIVLTLAGGVAYAATILLGVRLGVWPDFLAVVESFIPERLRRLVHRGSKQ
jgi:O-antigen/teichoic acid export membrane protein